jgi:hypothetical protein
MAALSNQDDRGLAVFYQSLDLLCDSLAVCGK